MEEEDNFKQPEMVPVDLTTSSREVDVPSHRGTCKQEQDDDDQLLLYNVETCLDDNTRNEPIKLPSPSKQGNDTNNFEFVSVKVEPPEAESDDICDPPVNEESYREPCIVKYEPRVSDSGQVKETFESIDTQPSISTWHDVKHSCEICKASFTHETQLQDHLKSHNLKCRICDKTFKFKHSLKLHMAIHLDQSKDGKRSRDKSSTYRDGFTCDICNAVLTKKQSLKRHLVIHYPRQSFPCPVCHISLSTNQSFRKHLKKHTDIFKCDICDLLLASKESLIGHFKVHLAEDNRFVCNVCQMPFPSNSELLEHISSHVDSYKCEQCNGTFRSELLLQRHLKVHSAKIKFTCEICHKGIASKSLFKQHAFTHTDVFKCTLCEKRCGSQNKLKAHAEEKHSTEKKFSCEICYKSFLTQNYLKVHKIIHTDRYKCHHCDTRCLSLGALRTHMEIHTTRKTFPCDVCQKFYQSEAALKSHAVSHSDRYKCTKCSAKYSSNRDLKRHLQKVHLIFHEIDKSKRTLENQQQSCHYDKFKVTATSTSNMCKE